VIATPLCRCRLDWPGGVIPALAEKEVCHRGPREDHLGIPCRYDGYYVNSALPWLLSKILQNAVLRVKFQFLTKSSA
jgi:hypothetical protein